MDQKFDIAALVDEYEGEHAGRVLWADAYNPRVCGHHAERRLAYIGRHRADGAA